MGQNSGVALQWHWILLAGYIKATDETLFLAPPPFFFSFFSQPLSGRGNDFVHPLTYYIQDAPSTQYSNEVPKLSKETGSVHKVHNMPMMSPPKKCLPKSAFTAQLTLGRFYYINNWGGCKIGLSFLISKFFLSFFFSFSFKIYLCLFPKPWFGLKFSLLGVCCRMKFIVLRKSKF